LSSTTASDEVKSLASFRIQEAFAQDSVKLKTPSEITSILGISTNTLARITRLGLRPRAGKIDVEKLEKFIRNNPKAAALLPGNSSSVGVSR
jgi:hypothetical protein